MTTNNKAFVQTGTPINQDEMTQYNADELVKAETTTNNCQGFKSGSEWNGNKAGRPKGSLNRIQSLFYDDLYQDWDKHGNQAIVDLRLSSPVKYCQLVASILPKTVELDGDGEVRWLVASTPLTTTNEWYERHAIEHVQPLDSEED